MSLCLVFSLLFISTVSAEDTPDSLVDATFTIEFVTGTELVVDVAMTAYGLTIDDVYTAEEIASASDEKMGAFEFLRHGNLPYDSLRIILFRITWVFGLSISRVPVPLVPSWSSGYSIRV